MLISHRPEITCRPKPNAHADARVELADEHRDQEPDRRAGAARRRAPAPISASGNPACCCSSGGSSTIGVTFSMPKIVDQHQPERVIAVEQQPQVQERPLRGQAVRHEDVEGDAPRPGRLEP